MIRTSGFILAVVVRGIFAPAGMSAVFGAMLPLPTHNFGRLYL